MNNNIQEQLLDKIKLKVSDDEKLVDVIMETLCVSSDAAYRRLNGKVSLTIEETQILLNKYDISLGNFSSHKKDKVLFDYKPLSNIEFNFEGYLTGIRDNLREIKNLSNPEFTISVNETPIFQLFNMPHLTRFKFFFWSKSYLKIPTYKNKKFKREKIDRRVLQIGIEAHNIYNSIPSNELYCSETLRGILKQIEYYFEANLFEDNSYALELLDNVSSLSSHIKHQSEIGHKFVYGNEPNESKNSKFNMYLNDTFLPDNTYYLNHSNGELTYFSHNIMNIMMTTDSSYCVETKMILDRLIDNSTLISKIGSRDRDRFFSELELAIEKLRKRIQLALVLEST